MGGFHRFKGCVLILFCAVLQSQYAAIFSQAKIGAIFDQQTFAASKRETAEIVFRVFDVDGKDLVVKVRCYLALQSVTDDHGFGANCG